MTAPSGPIRDASVLVTGAAGFLGSHLVRTLVSAGATVFATGRSVTAGPRLADVEARIRWLPADVLAADSVRSVVATARPEVLFHAAGYTGGRAVTAAGRTDAFVDSFQINVLGTVNLLRAMQDTAPSGKVVRIGGLEEYGDGPLPFREDQRESPISPYGASQVAATHLCAAFRRATGLTVVSLRPALTYGPSQDASFFIPSLIAACLANAPFEMTSGDQTREFVHVTDVTRACLAAAVSPLAGIHVLNIGTGVEHSIRDVAATVGRLTGSSSEFRFGSRDAGTKGLPRLLCDPTLARDVLGWQASITLEQGLAHTIECFRATAPVVPSAPV